MVVAVRDDRAADVSTTFCSAHKMHIVDRKRGMCGICLREEKEMRRQNHKDRGAALYFDMLMALRNDPEISDANIAREFGVNGKTVAELRGRAGIPQSKGGALPKDKEERIVALFKEDLQISFSEIANFVGCSRVSVMNVLVKSKLVHRTSTAGLDDY